MQKVVPSGAFLIPDNAKRVFEGRIFDVYQWPQKMFDGTVATFEMIKRPDTLQVLAIHEGKILVLEDEQPGRPKDFKLPGGRLDNEDESWLHGSQRELQEETGYSFAEWRLIHVEQTAPKVEQFVPVFLAQQLTQQQAQQLDEDGERITCQWWPFEKLRKAILASEHIWLGYHLRLFSKVKSLDELLALPEFQGKTVER